MKKYDLIDLSTNKVVMTDTYKNIAAYLKKLLHNVVASHMQKIPIRGCAVVENEEELEVFLMKFYRGK